MTVGELDHLIGRMLSTGPKTAEVIHQNAANACSFYDVRAALAIWVRNGLARELGAGMYESTAG